MTHTRTACANWFQKLILRIIQQQKMFRVLLLALVASFANAFLSSRLTTRVETKIQMGDVFFDRNCPEKLKDANVIRDTCSKICALYILIYT